ncbi:hypothetical protein GH714_026000 [Hevea brasiliensis]|uniref:CP-type G domain-containing protein n=1 Tax=Hevea brasiliensis TaxID=3981 RepID=A0A6A6KXB4_HEVBR|nr:hypothetical protein GH714_026000 [Hevea brasiliensis]
MVKKSKKSKSKRIPLRQKYKVLRKVRQHHKKKAKEAKKLGLNKKRKVEKDPGIPNDWPFKEQELKALEARRARALEELEQKKAARKERAQKRKLGLLEDDDISKFADVASAKEQNFEERNGNDDVGGIARNRDNSDRAFYKELVKVIEESDVILEVLDARDPLDLVPREAVEKWLKYLREELPAVAFKCSTQEQRSNLGWKSSSKTAKTSNLLQTSDCLGAETLIKLLKNYSRSHDIKKSITVGVIGLPNVGKSSLINSLKRCHVVNVGATPGLTRSMQEVQLDKNVKLLDCPGVVLLKSGENDASIALRNCKRIEKLDDPINPVKEILKLCPARLLVTLYKIPNFESVDDFLQKVATVRGRLKKGGIVDVEAAARIVLHDWNESMSSEEDDANKNKAKTTNSRQNEKLYAVEGMLNTKMKRAEKKRRKKAAKVDAMDDDYDFKVDYVKKKGSAMDVEDESGKKDDDDDDDQITGEVPMSGVRFDDE